MPGAFALQMTGNLRKWHCILAFSIDRFHIQSKRKYSKRKNQENGLLLKILRNFQVRCCVYYKV